MSRPIRCITDALRWLSTEFSASRPDAQRALGPQLAEGLVAQGFAVEGRDGRLAVAERGRRLLADRDRSPSEDDDA